MNAATWIKRALIAATLALPLAAHADTWPGRCGSGRFICVDVIVVDNGASVSVSLPEPIEVVKGQKVVWRLPIGFAFADGDGIAVPTTANEVDSANRVDDDETDVGSLSMRFRIRITKRFVVSSYKYTLTFHEMNGGKADTLITCDPTIANFDGIFKGKHPTRAFIVFTCRKT